ncbi:MAG TPA: response regulator [Pyrinomonadaceae bacterium]|jgi:nucleoside phosphorylase/CheY-like chemotaxis protein
MKTYILIIEDHPLTRDIYHERLESEGYEVKSVASGDEGIVSIQHRIPDLVILDLEMPGMPGLEVCEQIRSNPRTKDIPILMLTNHSHLESEGLNVGANDYLTKDVARAIFLARVKNLLTRGHQAARLSTEQTIPTIGIITALEKEYAAVKAVLENPKEFVVPGRGAGRRYALGHVPAPNDGTHYLSVSLADMGNNIAAARASLLLEHFPNVRGIIMVGIAGGVPQPRKPDEHVRLGDVVVSNQRGVIQYDFDKETPTETVLRFPPRPPSAHLVEAVRLLKAEELAGHRPWLRHIDSAMNVLGIQRPAEATDILVRSSPPRRKIAHPLDQKRITGQPRIFIGPVASANKLLKNPLKRDALRDAYSVKAVEMEGSGIADATWNHDTGYLVVRGICDYCDLNKGDLWQEYAAIVAAAYTRALLESIPNTLE